MTKRTKSERELLLDASLEFVMNSPDDVFDEYLKEAGEDGDELARRASNAIGTVLARHAQAQEAVGTTANTGAEDKLAALSVPQQREVAKRLGIPRNVLTGFRERRVIPPTVPRPFLSRLAAEIGAAVDELRSMLAQPLVVTPAHQHKADDKPQEHLQCSFEQLLIDAGVSPEKRAELLRDID